MSLTVQAWGGPRDGETFLSLSLRTWDAFEGGYYSIGTVERRQHKLVLLRTVLKWHESSHT